MKITSASKKVLASALSAAMVVAFAPAVALAAPTSPIPVKDSDDAAMATLGFVAKTYDVGSNGYVYYTADDIKGGESYILIADIDKTIALDTASATTIDLNGHKIETKDKAAIINSAGNLTLKNGTVSAAKDADSVKRIAIVDSQASEQTITLENVSVSGDKASFDVESSGVTARADKLTIKNGTYGKLFGKSVTIQGAVETKAIDASVAMTKNASLTVVAESTGANENAMGISKGLTMAEGATATVTATSKYGTATAIASGYTGAKKAAVTATAKAVAVDEAATAIAGTVNGSFEGAVINASAVSAGEAYGISTVNSAGTVAMNAGTVSAEGKSSTDSYAIGGEGAATLAGGTYTGKLAIMAKGTGGSAITGGKYSANPTAFVNTTDYDVSKNADGLYVVQQFDGFNINGENTNADVVTYVETAVQQMVKGETPAGIQLAEGVTPEAFIAQAQKGFTVKTKYVEYVEKNATDAQKAAKAAIDEALKADLAKLNVDKKYMTVSITMEYNVDGKVEPVVLGTVTALGQIANGLGTKQAVLEYTPAYTDVSASSNFVYAVVDGKAAKADWKKDVDGKPTEKVEFTAIPTLLTVAENDMEAIKDAAEQKPETPAVEKATQGIDVSKKSRTVKIGSKTKTAKAVSFKLGASAETELTIAKKSGSSRITVSGQKVTLKKGTKKGTFTAKVSLKAAGSDEYLAAAKTITVKFVVKK